MKYILLELHLQNKYEHICTNMKKYAYLIFIIISLNACKRDKGIEFNPAYKLSFSTDSILFDTVFTSVGSTFRTLKVFNTAKANIEISEIKLVGGANSQFKININGNAVSSVSKLRVNAKDSIYIFIKALINPNQANAPFIVQDTLEFLSNGNLQKIPVIAYGQNAVYFNNTELTTDYTFKKGIPYLIFNQLTIGRNSKANIQPGAKLFFHNGASLTVLGSLKANGTKQDSINFTSDRLERLYKDEPGQWRGLHFKKTSDDNSLNYCLIKNAVVGIRVDSLSNTAQPKLLLTNTIIKNHTIAGVLGYTATITAINNLIYNCGKYTFLGLYGGDYSFYQNTIVNYNYNFIRNEPSVAFSDNLEDNTNRFAALNLVMYNNIIWGSLENELQLNRGGNLAYNILFMKNVIKTSTLQDANNSNQDPLFIDSQKENYQLSDNSTALNKGFDLSSNPYFQTFLKTDLKGKSRTFPSEIGCYEK